MQCHHLLLRPIPPHNIADTKKKYIYTHIYIKNNILAHRRANKSPLYCTLFATGWYWCPSQSNTDALPKGVPSCAILMMVEESAVQYIRPKYTKTAGKELNQRRKDIH